MRGRPRPAPAGSRRPGRPSSRSGRRCPRRPRPGWRPSGASSSIVASLSTRPSARSGPQWPWSVYSHRQVSAIRTRSRSASRRRRSVSWTMPSSTQPPVPMASFSAGRPNRITPPTPSAASAAGVDERLVGGDALDAGHGADGLAAAAARAGTNSGATSWRGWIRVSRTKARRVSVRRVRRRRCAGSADQRPPASASTERGRGRGSSGSSGDGWVGTRVGVVERGVGRATRPRAAAVKAASDAASGDGATSTVREAQLAARPRRSCAPAAIDRRGEERGRARRSSARASEPAGRRAAGQHQDVERAVVEGRREQARGTPRAPRRSRRRRRR